ncbi:MAG: hypothetical protein ACRDH7_07260 [Actinomycetota bacterium]
MASATSEIFMRAPRKPWSRPSAHTVVSFVLLSVVLTLGIAHVVMAAPPDHPWHGALRVEAGDSGGRASASSDIIDVSGAYPGMPAQTSTFEVRNPGALPVTFAVTSTDLVVSGPRSLDDVLRITVRDPATGSVDYRGRLSGLSIERTRTLAAGASAMFTVQVTWPNTPADDAYQGAGLHFSLVARPSAG